ncbi:hypothetical protein B0H67DRAFT_361908 [Lasiosphaeris hirsuta]|uniref:Uncharacterized protein n=1 Tax=Lasiosphaeris hirsuta TaxID=260670 RepID=A0AA40DL59_9PEZI|nr:hypothetical protein B0H67DRAFT_361908 [Lasiosphaeris hirsuta]
MDLPSFQRNNTRETLSFVPTCNLGFGSSVWAVCYFSCLWSYCCNGHSLGGIGHVLFHGKRRKKFWFFAAFGLSDRLPDTARGRWIGEPFSDSLNIDAVGASSLAVVRRALELEQRRCACRLFTCTPHAGIPGTTRKGPEGVRKHKAGWGTPTQAHSSHTDETVSPPGRCVCAWVASPHALQLSLLTLTPILGILLPDMDPRRQCSQTTTERNF